MIPKDIIKISRKLIKKIKKENEEYLQKGFIDKYRLNCNKLNGITLLKEKLLQNDNKK